MTRRLLQVVAVLATCAMGCAQSPVLPSKSFGIVASTSYVDPATIQSKLDAGAGNNQPIGRTVFGQQVSIGAKIITLKKPLRITSMQELDGMGTQQTILRWDGAAGTSAIVVFTNMDHHYVKDVRISHLSIWCPNGADAIVKDSSVNVTHDVTMNDVWIVGGRVNLPGENYRTLLDDMRFTELCGQAIRLDGQVNVLRRVKIEGSTIGNVKPKSMIEVHGSIALEGFDWFEGAFPCPLLDVYDWVNPTDGSHWTGSVGVAGNVWIEHHRPNIAPVRLTNSDYYGPVISGNWIDSGNAWEINNSRIHVLP